MRAWAEEEAREEAEDIASGRKLSRARRGFRHYLFEASHYFGLSYPAFQSLPVHRRAEMIAHLILKDQADRYDLDRSKEEAERREEKKRQRSKGASAFNPAWMLGKGEES